MGLPKLRLLPSLLAALACTVMLAVANPSKIATSYEYLQGNLQSPVYNASPPTYTNGQYGQLQINASGGLVVDGSAVTQPVSLASGPLPSGAATATNQSRTQSAPGTPQTIAETIQGNASGVPVPVSGTFWQSTQPVSSTQLPVALKSGALPTNGATVFANYTAPALAQAATSTGAALVTFGSGSALTARACVSVSNTGNTDMWVGLSSTHHWKIVPAGTDRAIEAATGVSLYVFTVSGSTTYDCCEEGY